MTKYLNMIIHIIADFIMLFSIKINFEHLKLTFKFKRVFKLLLNENKLHT